MGLTCALRPFYRKRDAGLELKGAIYLPSIASLLALPRLSLMCEPTYGARATINEAAESLTRERGA